MSWCSSNPTLEQREDPGENIDPGRLGSCPAPDRRAGRPRQNRARAGETGVASYYGAPYDGQPTASGEIFDRNQYTAAHPRLAFGTRVRVTHLINHRSVVVRVNDRGPFVKGRVIDLSQAAAHELQMLASGVAEVKLEILN